MQGGARYEIAIDGSTRSRRDRKDMAIEATRRLKTKEPHCGLSGLVSRQVGDAQSALVAVSFEGLHLVRPSELPKAGGGDFDRVSGARRASILGELDLGRSTLLVTCIRRSCVEAETFLEDS